MGRYRGAYWVGLAAVIVGLSTFTWYTNPIPVNEGGSRSRRLELSYPTLGFFCWMGSLVLVPTSASILARKDSKAKAAAASVAA